MRNYRLPVTRYKIGKIKRFLLGIVLLMVLFSAKGASTEMKEITLPKPKTMGKVSIEETVSTRRSVRRYADKELTIEEKGQILWACQGETSGRGFRAAPSAGALYPLEVYVVQSDGLYHYIPRGHRLEQKSDKDLRSKLAAAAWGQGFIGQAPVSIVITAVYRRVTSRYGERGVRYTDMEAGHAAENIHLQAVALGLASAPIGAFDDNAVSGLLGLPKDQTPIYIIPVGYEK